MTGKFKQNIRLTFKFIRLALISGTIFIIVLLIAGGVLTYIYRDDVKDMMIHSLNRHIKTEIHVENIRFDVFRRFPNASVTFDNVVVYEVSQKEIKNILLEAEKIFFKFSIYDLLRKNYKIKHLEINNGSFKPVKNIDGTNNYIFWHESTDQPTGEFEFDLQRINLINFEISYFDQYKNNKYHIISKESKISGKFSQNDYNMTVGSKIEINYITIENRSIITNKDVDFDIVFGVEDNILFNIYHGLITMNGNSFEASGYIRTGEPADYFDLILTGKNIKLQNLINDLPSEYKNYFEGYRSRGDLYFNAVVKGNNSRYENPHVVAKFGIYEGSLNNRSKNLNISRLSFDANYDNGRYRSLTTSKFVVNNLSALVNNGKINGNLSISDLIKPNIKFNMDAAMSALDFIELSKLEQINVKSGELLFAINYEGTLENIHKKAQFDFKQLLGSYTSGTLKIKDVSFFVEDKRWQYESLNGLFQFNNDDLIVNSFDGKISGNDFRMSGYFRNILPYIFDDRQRMVIDASFTSDNINLDALLRDDDSNADTITYKLEFSDRVDFNLSADISQFEFGKFHASNLKGGLHMNNKKFMASNISFNSMNGNITGNIYVNDIDSDILFIGCDAKINNVDADQMFYQVGNFGQNVLIDKNLKGNITADIQLTSSWSTNLEIDWNSLETAAIIKIENGELIDFEPMMALSRFLRVDDLEHVVFSGLYNEIRIKDREIIIPDMEISSNAFNIKISGEHSFENEIDYRLQILLSELLARKNRQHRNPQEQYGDITDDGLGRTTLFLAISGNINDPVIRYDYEGVREKLRDDLRQERKELEDILRNEFSWIQKNKEDKIATERKEEMQRIKKQEKGEFVIEFDDF